MDKRMICRITPKLMGVCLESLIYLIKLIKLKLIYIILYYISTQFPPKTRTRVARDSQQLYDTAFLFSKSKNLSHWKLEKKKDFQF
jgi:hypothetical protein